MTFIKLRSDFLRKSSIKKERKKKKDILSKEDKYLVIIFCKL